MPSCTAVGCRTRQNDKKSQQPIKGNKKKPFSDKSLFNYPKDPILRQKWVKATNRIDFVPSATSRLCWKHFKPSDFRAKKSTKTQVKNNSNSSVVQGRKSTRRILKEKAVPSIFNERLWVILKMRGLLRPRQEKKLRNLFVENPKIAFSTRITERDMKPCVVKLERMKKFMTCNELELEYEMLVEQARVGNLENTRIKFDIMAMEENIQRVDEALKRAMSLLEFEKVKLIKYKAQRDAILLPPEGATFLTESQIAELRANRQSGWTSSMGAETQAKAQEIIDNAGFDAYEMLRHHGIPLPKRRTLQRNKQKILEVIANQKSAQEEHEKVHQNTSDWERRSDNQQQEFSGDDELQKAVNRILDL